jgi:hypothetical protein
MRRTALATALLLAAVSASAAQNKVSKTFDAPDGGKLVLTADVGDLRVTTGGRGVTVDVSMNGREDSIREYHVTFRQEGNTVYVDGDYDRHGWRFFDTDNLHVKYVISVPRRFQVDLQTSGGDIDLADLDGEVLARTSGGDIEIGNTGGNVTAKTSGGDIKVRGANGTLKVNTSGGDIDIDSANAQVDARTSGGDVQIRRAGGNVVARSSGGGIEIDEAYGAIDASTSGGSINARFSRQPNADSRLVTSGGGVSVTLASNLRADIDAHTSGGGISTSIPIQVLGKQDEDTLIGTVNGGGPKLYVRTSGGGISLKRM